MKRAIVAVINDLSSDQRVHKACLLLIELGYEVLLVGRVLPDSKPLERAYKTHRMRLVFRSGPLFYFEFQIRLFLFLLFRKSNLILSNDLDTLAPSFLIGKFKGSKLIYDTHEYFTGVPELQDATFKRHCWEWLEGLFFPKLKNVITVNESIAEIYRQKYGVDVHVVRNVPPRIVRASSISKHALREKLQLPTEKTILILQGAGINVHRGAEEAVLSMEFLPDAFLLIIGSGDVFPLLPDLVRQAGASDRIKILDRIPYQQLVEFTQAADWGLTLDKPNNLNYQLSLPNKLFDYIQCGVPVIASPIKEIKSILYRYQVGLCVDEVNPIRIAELIKSCSLESNQYNSMVKACNSAAEDLCWEKESKILRTLYSAGGS